jgi:hypothetical protein
MQKTYLYKSGVKKSPINMDSAHHHNCDKTEMGSLARQWPLKNSSMSRAKERWAKGKIGGCNAVS